MARTLSARSVYHLSSRAFGANRSTTHFNLHLSHPLCPRSFFSRCHSSLIHFSLFVYIFDSFWYLHPYFLSYSYNLNSEKHQNTEQWCTNPTIHLSRPSSPVGQRRARLWRRGLTISITRCVRILCKSGKEGNVCHS